MAFRPAALILRLAFATTGAAGSGCWAVPLIEAQRRRWASFICLRAAAENFLRLPVEGAAAASGLSDLPPSIPSNFSYLFLDLLFLKPETGQSRLEYLG
jgi:hypothetical protein